MTFNEQQMRDKMTLILDTAKSITTRYLDKLIPIEFTGINVNENGDYILTMRQMYVTLPGSPDIIEIIFEKNDVEEKLKQGAQEFVFYVRNKIGSEFFEGGQNEEFNRNDQEGISAQ